MGRGGVEIDNGGEVWPSYGLPGSFIDDDGLRAALGGGRSWCRVGEWQLMRGLKGF